MLVHGIKNKGLLLHFNFVEGNICFCFIPVEKYHRIVSYTIHTHFRFRCDSPGPIRKMHLKDLLFFSSSNYIKPVCFNQTWHKPVKIHVCMSVYTITNILLDVDLTLRTINVSIIMILIYSFSFGCRGLVVSHISGYRLNITAEWCIMGFMDTSLDGFIPCRPNGVSTWS